MGLIDEYYAQQEYKKNKGKIESLNAINEYLRHKIYCDLKKFNHFELLEVVDYFFPR